MTGRSVLVVQECSRAGLLSQREREVIEWTGKGKTASEAGLILGISEHTVAQHLKTIRRKLGCSNNAHAVLRALQTGQFGL